MSENRCAKRRHETSLEQHGIALILVLWILTILMGIVLSFSFAARTETLATLTFKKGIKTKFLAEAGIEHGILEILYRLNSPSLNRDDAVRTDGTVYSYQSDMGQYTVRIIDESGKVDINKAPELLLRSMFTYSGLETDDVDTITDSIMDWRDGDDLHRLNGAESDYYLSLPNPYHAKNADFDTLEELIMIKGITPEILYGKGSQRGIIDLLTIYSNTRKINLDAAPREVLLSVPGITPDSADTIIDLRENQEMYNLEASLGGDYAVAAPYVSSAASRTFSIEAVGYTGDEKTGFPIRAVVNIDRWNTHHYLYYKSPADVQHARDTDA
jgi:general secretion pathway protein K